MIELQNTFGFFPNTFRVEQGTYISTYAGSYAQDMLTYSGILGF